MRKFILIAAMVLVSATARAEGTRSLTLASSDEPAAAAPAKAVEASKEAPKYVERPAAVDTKVQPVKTEETKSVADANTSTPRTEKPKRKRESTEARVIRELHRHGIYW